MAQNLFEAVIKVNDQAITRYEIEQRARMLTLFRAPGDPHELAREQLIEDRLKLECGPAPTASCWKMTEVQLGDRGICRPRQHERRTDGARPRRGRCCEHIARFVRVGLTWRELTRARFASRVSVTESDLERAKAASVSGSNSDRRARAAVGNHHARPAQIRPWRCRNARRAFRKMTIRGRVFGRRPALFRHAHAWARRADGLGAADPAAAAAAHRSSWRLPPAK